MKNNNQTLLVALVNVAVTITGLLMINYGFGFGVTRWFIAGWGILIILNVIFGKKVK